MAWFVARPSPNQKAKPMGNAYEIYALRYATMSPRTPHMNFLSPDPHDTAAQDLDYFVWLIRGGGRDILVDTGFNAEEEKWPPRKRRLTPAVPPAAFASKANAIKTTIVRKPNNDTPAISTASP